MKQTKVTEIQIYPIKPQNGLVALAHIVLNNELFLGSIGIHKKLRGDGYRITYPTKRLKEKSINLYHPINKELGELIKKSIIKKLNQIQIA